MHQELYNQLPKSVRLSSCGYRMPHQDEVFYRSQGEAEAARELYPNLSTLVNPSVLVTFQHTRIVLDVPISDFGKVEGLFAACQRSDAFQSVEVVWELSFLSDGSGSDAA